jgi:membrane-bound lytic murein transglycosylase D
MPQTAKLYKLHINEYVDERRDLIKSTEAAASYLSALHKRFGKWYLAAIAYNCGGGRLNQAIKKAGTDDLAILLEPKKKYIPKESRLYIRKIALMAILANDTNFIVDNDASYLLNRGSSSSLVRVEVPGGTIIDEVARVIKMSARDLKKLNIHYRYNFTNPFRKKTYLYIPYEKKRLFAKNFDPKRAKKVLKHRVYIVKKGDSLYKIAKKFHTSYKDIKRYNKLSSNNLRIGKKLLIPLLKKNRRYKRRSVYIVKSGDTLSSISNRYNVSIKRLMSYNSLKSSFLKPGKKLVIP